MNNKELQAETVVQQSKIAELLPSAPLVANPMLYAVPPERTLELCRIVLAHLNSKLNQDCITEPSINKVACLAADILKELRQA